MRHDHCSLRRDAVMVDGITVIYDDDNESLPVTRMMGALW
jgi:hypothetical protein